MRNVRFVDFKEHKIALFQRCLIFDRIALIEQCTRAAAQGKVESSFVNILHQSGAIDSLFRFSAKLVTDTNPSISFAVKREISARIKEQAVVFKVLHHQAVRGAQSDCLISCNKAVRLT